jgi:hypothetical protein
VAFEKVLLLTGIPRAEYIQQRLAAGIAPKAILAEINHVAMYSGKIGEKWPIAVVYVEKKKLDAAAKALTIAREMKDSKLIGEVHPIKEPEQVDFPEDEELKPELPEVPDAYEGILSPEDVAAVYAEADAKVKADAVKKAKAELLAKAEAELKREAHLAQLRAESTTGDLVDVDIDLAPYAPWVRINGREFLHGVRYRVRRDVACVLLEQIQRTWDHEKSTKGERSDRERFRQRNTVIGHSFAAAQGVRA